MDKPQIIETPSGDRLAVIPVEEYERLVAEAENAADVRAYDDAKAALAAGRDEMLPSALAGRILSGENPIRVWREHRGMTGRELAARANLSAAYLSEIESGKKSGSIEAVKALARTLGVAVDDLI